MLEKYFDLEFDLLRQRHKLILMQLFSRVGAMHSLKVHDYCVYLIKQLLIIFAFSLVPAAQSLFFVLNVK